MRNLLLTGLLSLGFLIPATSFAERNAVSLPTDTRHAVFDYDKNQTFIVLTKTGKSTHLEFAPDEKIIGKSVGDSILFKVDQAEDNGFMIRPTYSGKETSLNVITTKRNYYFMLISSPENGKWYQHASFDYPNQDLYQRTKKQLAYDASTEDINIKPEVVSQPKMNNFELADYFDNYSADGDDAIKPKFVADDGNTTTLLFEDDQELPALFVQGENNKYAMVSYDVSDSGDAIYLRKVVNKMYLKLGNKEVVIKRKGLNNKSRSINPIRRMFGRH